MKRVLRFTPTAAGQLASLQTTPSQAGLCKQVLKTLGLLETNARHPGLHTHEYRSFSDPAGGKIWEAYVQNNTPGAYRVFFHYGPDLLKGKKRIPVLTIVAITAHP